MLDTYQKDIAAKMLGELFNSAAFQEMWGRYNRTQRNENPGPEIAALSMAHGNFPGTEEERIQLYSFLNEYVRIYKDALGTPSPTDNEQTISYKEHLTKLHAHLNCEVGGAIIHRGMLPDGYQKIINMVEMDTAQDSVRPFGTLKDFTIQMIHHFNEFRQNKPALFYGMVGSAITFVSMGYWKVGNSAAPYVDPEMLFDKNLSAEAFLDMDTDYTPNVDYAALQASDLTSIKLPCHDHFHQMFGDTWLDRQYQSLYGETMAQSAAGFFGEDSTFIFHCGKLKTIVADTTNFANDFTSAWTARLSPIIEGPATTAGDFAFSEGAHREAFMDGVELMADFIYWFDNVENLAIHLSLFGMGYIGAARTGVMDHEEAKESREIIHNFTYRIWKNNPLNVFLGGSGIAFAAYNGGDASNIVVGGLAGLTAGYLAHRFHRVMSREKTALHQLSEMDTTLTLEAVQGSDITRPADVISDIGVENDQRKPWYKRHKRKVITSGAVAAAAASDAVLTGGYYTTASMGAGSVAAVYIPANIIQDNISHVVFLLGGIGTALVTYVGPVRTARGVKTLFSASNMNEMFPATDNPYAWEIAHKHNHLNGCEEGVCAPVIAH
ncbi:MAG: hypothetical protein ACRBCT_02170 [Alphaproteobacteria bacterium]